MKTLFTALLLAAGIASQAQTHFKTDSVYLSGTIQNFAKHLDSADAVKVVVNDLALDKQLTYLGKIAPDGSYRLTFIKTGAQDVFITYKDDLDVILVTPGAHTQVNFNADDFVHTLSFKGDDAQANQDYLNFDKAKATFDEAKYGNDRYARYRELAASQKDNEPDAYREFLKKRFTRDSSFLYGYLKKHRLTPLFTQWAKANLQCEYWNEIMRYRWMHPMQNKIKQADFKVPDGYYDFAKTADLNNYQLAVSSYYGDFLNEYRMYLSEKTLGRVYANAAEMKFYTGLPAGLAKDVMLCNLLSQKIKSKQVDVFTPYMAEFRKTVSEPAFKTSLVEAYTVALNQLNNFTVPINAQLNTVPKSESDKVFANIISKYPGKVVYIDFWATWCGPCLAEMPNSKTLHDKYAGKDVVFLYLASQSPEKTWKSVIAEKEIKGEHFLLTNNEFSAISEKFQISGIPRYLLVDKTGRVADDNARRPGDNQLPGDIDKLLAVK